MAPNISWQLYRAFLAVIDEGSLSAAARALDIAQPTVGRQIAALEKALGLALFTRSQAGLMPTEAAQSLRALAEDMRTTAASLERAAASQGAGVQGTVRVTASDIIGIEVLPPIIAALRDRHPQLIVELVLTNRVQDLLRREADIAVRMLRPAQASLVARRVGHLTLGLHAHRRYVARHGTPSGIAELAAHSLIGFDQPTEFIRNATKAWPLWRREAFTLRADSDVAQLALIRAGAGIGVCQVAMARRDEGMVRILPKLFSLALETWITMHEDLRNNQRCKVTFDALVKGMQDHVGLGRRTSP